MSINAKDLRTGNWVSIVGDPAKYKDYHQVTGLIGYEIQIHNNEVGPMVEYWGIPLTKEVLEAFNLKFWAGLWHITIDENEFLIEFAGSHCQLICFGIHVGIPFQYVHQLQNIIHSLTGQELVYNPELKK